MTRGLGNEVLIVPTPVGLASASVLTLEILLKVGYLRIPKTTLWEYRMWLGRLEGKTFLNEPETPFRIGCVR
jgi:hypothetical protein